MKYICNVIIFATAIVMIAGCNKKVEPELTIYPNSMTGSSDGGTFIFEIESNTDWTAENSKSTVEFSLSPEKGHGNGVITLEIPRNDAASIAQVRVKVTARGTETAISDFVTVTIEGNPSISVDKSAIELPANGGGRLVHITANESWSAEAVTITKAGSNTSWCNATKLESDGNLELNISADANNTGVTRYAQFKLYLDNQPQIYCTVEVSQPSVQ